MAGIPDEDRGETVDNSKSEQGNRPPGRDEMNLAEFPFALLRPQQGEEDSFTYEGSILDKNGNRQRQRWTVRGAGGLGLPTEYDERIVIALMAISAEQGFETRKVPFSVYQVLKVMGITRSQRAYEAVQRSLDRLVGVTIYAEGAFWDNGEKEWLTLKAGFHIIEKFWLAYLEKDEKVREKEGVPGYFIWSEDIWKSIEDGYIKYLDLDFYFDLNLPLARRLYRFLDKRMAYQTEYEIDIFELAKRLGMARYDYPSEVLRKLRPGLDELIEKGFLLRAEPVKVGRYTRVHFERVAGQLPDESAPPPQSEATSEDQVEEGRVEEALIARGFSTAVARQLVEEYGAEHVRQKMDYLHWEVEVRGRRLRSPRGWLRRAIEDDYSAPAGYDPLWSSSDKGASQSAEDALETTSEKFEDEWPSEPRREDISIERGLWQEVLREMEGQLTRATFQNLFTGTRLIKVQEDVAVIAVPSTPVQEWLENRLKQPLADALARHTGQPMRLVFVHMVSR